MVRKVKAFLISDRQSRATAAQDVTPRLELSASARSLLHHLLRQRLTALRRDVEDQLGGLAQLRQEQAGIKHALEITPEEESIGKFLKRLREKDERLATLTAEGNRLDIVFKEATADLKVREAKLQAMKEREAKEEFAQDDRMRMARIAGKTRDVMRDFLARATERKIDRLSELITDSFRFLLRKQTMVERIHIDPLTFAITLFNEAGQALPKQRLSEGEKQLFAILVLWGLARASAHPLPAIIDTPMARRMRRTGATSSSDTSRMRVTRWSSFRPTPKWIGIITTPSSPTSLGRITSATRKRHGRRERKKGTSGGKPLRAAS
jgi:DNA sulfur modification protein DndD